jgi:hypothetical protein
VTAAGDIAQRDEIRGRVAALPFCFPLNTFFNERVPLAALATLSLPPWMFRPTLAAKKRCPYSLARHVQSVPPWITPLL